MPLLDHFRPPVGRRRHWHSFLSSWANMIASDLNARLPGRYFAESWVHFGGQIDDETVEDAVVGSADDPWVLPDPTKSIAFPVLDASVEVLVYESSAGPIIAGAIELVAPSNTDRSIHREAFISKCETHLHSGAGLMIVDIVTAPSANLHNGLMSRLLAPESEPGGDLYSTSYRPIIRLGRWDLDVWIEPMLIGEKLPVLPLWLKGGLCLPLNLDDSYHRTRSGLRMDDDF